MHPLCTERYPAPVSFQAVDRGEASVEDLRLMMDVTDAARLLVARQLDVGELYSSFTHLVSRTHVPGQFIKTLVSRTNVIS